MRRLAATVSIITAHYDGRVAGMSATAIAPVSMEPPSLLICVNLNASVHALITASGEFCVNLLHADQRQLGSEFSGRLDQNERFKRGNWLTRDDGSLYLDDAQAVIFCKTARHMVFGTHSVFIGIAETCMVDERVDPLLYADARFVSLAKQ